MHSALLTILGLLSGSGESARDGTVIFTRQGAVTARTWQLDPDRGIDAVSATGDPIAIPSSALLVLSTGRDAAPASGLVQVKLRNGEVVAAEFAPDPPPGSAAFVSSLWGRLEIPIEQIASLSLAPATLGEDYPPAPFVLLANGDALAGRVQQIRPQELMVNTEFGETPIPMASVAGIVFSDDPPQIDARRPGLYLIELSDGQRVYCDELSNDGRDMVRLRRGDARGQVACQSVRRIVWPAAAIAWASGMAFSGNGTGYFGEKVTPLRDRNACGRPLRLGQRWFARGIGTRGRSRVTLRLDARWVHLEGRVGLDPWLGRTGHCTVTVTADDREAFRAELPPGADERLAIPVGGVKELRLGTDFGLRGDLGDYVNWCDLLLIGERQSTVAPATRPNDAE